MTEKEKLSKVKKSMKKILFTALSLVLMLSVPFRSFAMEDGAYTVSRTTSYANPETGETVDGGTNIALGDSMCESLVDEKILVEQSNGKTYVTLGLGLMSNVSNVAFQIQGNDGEYRDVEYTQTGSCERMDDVCNHYRFEVDSAENLISPIVFVDPMGRDVQFFVKLDMDTAEPGTGVYVSEMIGKEEPEADKADKAEKAETEEAPEEAQTEENEESNTGMIVIGVVAVLIVAGGFVVFSKKRKG